MNAVLQKLDLPRLKASQDRWQCGGGGIRRKPGTKSFRILALFGLGSTSVSIIRGGCKVLYFTKQGSEACTARPFLELKRVPGEDTTYHSALPDLPNYSSFAGTVRPSCRLRWDQDVAARPSALCCLARAKKSERPFRYTLACTNSADKCSLLKLVLLSYLVAILPAMPLPRRAPWADETDSELEASFALTASRRGPIRGLGNTGAGICCARVRLLGGVLCAA